MSGTQRTAARDEHGLTASGTFAGRSAGASAEVLRASPDGVSPGTDRAVAKKLSPRGLAAAAGAFVWWGLFPVYLKPLHDVPALQVIAHRIAWSFLFILGWMFLRGEFGKLRAALSKPPIVARLVITAILISINWLVYVWGVGHGHVIETSLGYFINPLVNVLLGVIVLRERLNRAQWLAVAIAAAAVVYLTVMTGRPPWISLTVATSFGLYGLLRKVIAVEALPGLATETLLLLPLGVGYLIWCEATGVGVFGHTTAGIDALLLGCGPLTAIPLFLFAYGARLIPYSTVGLLQYIAPTLQLLCGVFLYGEPFEGSRALGFALIWSALVVYAADGLWRARKVAG